MVFGEEAPPSRTWGVSSVEPRIHNLQDHRWWNPKTTDKLFRSTNLVIDNFPRWHVLHSYPLKETTRKLWRRSARSIVWSGFQLVADVRPIVFGFTLSTGLECCSRVSYKFLPDVSSRRLIFVHVHNFLSHVTGATFMNEMVGEKSSIHPVLNWSTQGQ